MPNLKGIKNMSGIFAYIGNKPCKEILVNGIAMLDSRGNDSTGIVLKEKDSFNCIKTKGDISKLKQATSTIKSDSTIGLAQCDKAIRTKPTQLTAKPVFNNLFSVVTDGYIDNFSELKHWTNNPFPILTDEDLILAMMCVINKNDKFELIKTIDSMIIGDVSYSFISNDENAIYCKSNGKPIVIGFADKGYVISSELKAINSIASKYIFIDDGECAKVTKDKITILDSKYKRIKKSPSPMPEQSYFNNDYSINDEIYYCPIAVKESCKQFISKSKLDFDYLKLNRHAVDKISRIILVGTSTSYNVAKLCKYNLSMMCDIPTIAYQSNELRYSGCVIDKNSLLIAISHSGESSDTVACAKRFKANGAKTFAVTGNNQSYLAHICDEIIDTGCDYNGSNNSLRAYISSYLALTFLSLYIGYKNSVVTELYLNVTIKMAEMLSGKVSSVVKPSPTFELLANDLIKYSNIFITGLGADYAISLEASDKLRTIAKLNSTAYPLGEIEQKCTPILADSYIIAMITNKELLQKSLIKLRRLKSIGAKITIITTQSIEEEINDFNNIIEFNDSIPIFNTLPCVTAVYKLAVTIDEIKNKPDIDIAG